MGVIFKRRCLFVMFYRRNSTRSLPVRFFMLSLSVCVRGGEVVQISVRVEAQAYATDIRLVRVLQMGKTKKVSQIPTWNC